MGTVHNTSVAAVLTTLQAHPAALLFPKMSEDELSNLSEDIAKNGLLESIVLYGGQILDGLNRLAACQKAGVEPHFIEIDGELPSPTIYVLSKNLHRRHLTPSQRGAIAAEAEPLFKDEARKRQLSGLNNQDHSSFRPVGHNDNGSTRKVVADALQVGEGTVQRAIEVKQADPALFEKIKSGELTAYGARRLVNESHVPKDERTVSAEGPYEPKTDGQKKKAESQKQRMVSALSTIASLCRGLNEELDLRVAISVCSNEDIATWAAHAREAAKHLRTFTSNLERNT